MTHIIKNNKIYKILNVIGFRSNFFLIFKMLSIVIHQMNLISKSLPLSLKLSTYIDRGKCLNLLFQRHVNTRQKDKACVQLATYLGGLCVLLYSWSVNCHFFLYCQKHHRFLFFHLRFFFQLLCSWKFRKMSSGCKGNWESFTRLSRNSFSLSFIPVCKMNTR